MVDPRVILELDASVPVYRAKGGIWDIEPPGQFQGAVLRTAAGYECWRYPPPAKDGLPFAIMDALIEALAAFEYRALENRKRLTP